ncbi:PhnD/SsuA/transferrin family substrate-binding protein [Egicoccus sp. AB-alg6-2]|uniref:PhnD/SsuA/transferrin family substrate-binding protein n=1 Tax=Egicoccus sp. AB-alg6-2 TaxID=3242692 RepID=UPI00359CFFEC
MTTKVPVTLACGPYDRMEALREGLVQPEGVALTYVPIQSPPELFARMVKRQSFDVSEMSLSLYTQLRTRGEFPFVALPVFPSRMFRHGYIFVHAASGIEHPLDLAGKRVGVQEYHQTAGVWIRGILSSQYGVDLGTIAWREGGVNAPRTPDVLDLRPRGELDIEFVGADVSLDELLATGEIDAYLGARQPRSFSTSPDVRRLFPDYRTVERQFYADTGIFPMMHTIVIREELLERHPWLSESLFKAFEAAKTWCLEQMRFSGTARYTLPWLHADIEEIDEVFGGDPWPYGLEANRVPLEAFVGYLVEQRFLDQPVDIERLFPALELRNE